MGPLRRTVEWIDRVGGRFFYRLIGLLVSFMAFASGFAAWQTLPRSEATTADRIAGVVFAVLSGVLARLAIWCFSPARRLSDIE